MTSEKQLPFGQNTRKEVKDKAENIEGHSESVGQHARKNGIENDKQTTMLRTFECTSELSKGSKEQNKNEKGFPLCLKIKGFDWWIKNKKLKLEENLV
jgi:hypothetical protein